MSAKSTLGGRIDQETSRKFEERVRDILREHEDNERRARHKISLAIVELFDEPVRETTIKRELESAAGAFVTIRVTNEVLGKLDARGFEVVA